MDSGFCDVEGTQGLLGQVLASASADVTGSPDAQTDKFRQRIEFAQDSVGDRDILRRAAIHETVGLAC